jgi:hypothetical protein
VRPWLADHPSQFLLLERAVEDEYRPRMLNELQCRVDALAESASGSSPACAGCGQQMVCQDIRPVSWWARFGRLRTRVARYRCPACHSECRPLLDLLGVEPGRVSGSLARLLALLAAIVPYPLAARLAGLLLGVTISPMGVWRVAQRLGQAAASYSDGLSQYHADSRSEGTPTRATPATVLLSVDGCSRRDCLRYRPWRRVISAKSRQEFCCCRTNVSKPRLDAARWCGAFWSVVWETPMRSSTGCMRNCGNWAGSAPTPWW